MIVNFKYSSKGLDSRLKTLSESMSKIFGMSSTGFFISLVNYGLNNEVLGYESYDSKGPSFRYETDNEYDSSIIILITDYLRINNLSNELIDILSTQIKLDKILNELVKIANDAGTSLLNNELSSYKHNLSKNDERYFVIDVLSSLLNSKVDSNVF